MEKIHKTVASVLEQSMTFPVVCTKLIADKLKQRGIILTEEQRRRIRKDLEAGDYEHFKIDISDEQIANATVTEEERAQQGLTIDIGDENKLDELIEEITISVFEKAIPQFTGILQEAFKKQRKSLLHSRDQQQGKIEKEVGRVWGKAIERLTVFVALAQDFGAEFNDYYRSSAAQNNDYIFEVLTRIHARGCQIADEVITLLSAGFADGAHARWRTLDELDVVAAFIVKYGQQTAEQYLLHEYIESYRAAVQMREHSGRIMEQPPSDEEMDNLRTAKEHLVSLFGKSFEKEYGWASSALGKENPRFSDLEKDVELDHERPYYRLASHNVHANAKGIRFRLGSPPDSDVLVAGPSIFGLADPGDGAALALMRITMALVLTRPTLDTLALCQVLTALRQEVADLFQAAHCKLTGYDPNKDAQN